jgi:hypothetical protein
LELRRCWEHLAPRQKGCRSNDYKRDTYLAKKKPVIVLVLIGLTISLMLTVLLVRSSGNKSTARYSEQEVAAVQQTAQAELIKRGLMDKVSDLGYGEQGIVLGFWGKADPQIVSIVQSTIDEKAPGLSLEIVEDVNVITQTSTT